MYRPLWLNMFIYSWNFIMISICIDLFSVPTKILHSQKNPANKVPFIYSTYAALTFYYWLYLRNHLHDIKKYQILPALIIVSVSFWAHLDLIWYMPFTLTDISLVMVLHSFRYGFFLLIIPLFVLLTVRLCK